MKNHTSFKIGGAADELWQAESADDILKAISSAKERNLEYTIIGNGSNLLVSDKGIRGVVIEIASGFDNVEVEGNVITAQSGVLLSRLAKTALSYGLEGLEFASGIPGTLGGGVYMNAGAYGGEMKQVVTSVRCIENGEIVEISEDELDFGYRSSYFSKHDTVILEARMELKAADKEQIKAKMEDFRIRRTTKQPLEFPSAGSVFKRPEGYFAGKLIEDCNLKGFTVGGAKVSEKHSGFIINSGGATAEDVKALIKHIQKTVLEQFGVELKTEIKFIGEN